MAPSILRRWQGCTAGLRTNPTNDRLELVHRLSPRCPPSPDNNPAQLSTSCALIHKKARHQQQPRPARPVQPGRAPVAEGGSARRSSSSNRSCRYRAPTLSGSRIPEVGSRKLGDVDRQTPRATAGTALATTPARRMTSATSAPGDRPANRILAHPTLDTRPGCPTISTRAADDARTDPGTGCRSHRHTDPRP